MPELAVIAGVAAAYAVGLRRLGRRPGGRQAPGPLPAGAFVGGLAAMTAVVAPPLHHAAGEHLAPHMVQHVVLLGVAGPLLAAGRPGSVLLAALPDRARRRLRPARRFLLGSRPQRSSTRMATAGVLQVGVMAGWHVPALYQAAMGDEVVHFAQHTSFLAASVIFWMALVGARRRAGAGVVAVFIATLPATALGAALTFASRPWYPAYGTGLDALADQQLAGVIMWGFGGLAAVAGGCLLFAAWLGGASRLALHPPLPAVLFAVAAVAAVAAAAGCSEPNPRVRVGKGNPQLGEEAIEAYGCGSCHTIPGIKGADALVGPPLVHFSKRSYIAGVLANTPDNLARWIDNPQAVEPGTAMPDLGVSPGEAANIAAYLLSLE